MTTKITKEEVRQMVRESVQRKLKEKLLGEAVNVRAGTDIILAAEKEWHDFVYNVICKQLGLAGVETMPDDMGNKILAVIKSEWPSIRSAVSSAAEKLSGFPKDGESNSVTNIQNPGMVAEQSRMATGKVTFPKEFPTAEWTSDRIDAWAAEHQAEKKKKADQERFNPPEPRLPQTVKDWQLFTNPGSEQAAIALTKALEGAGKKLENEVRSFKGLDPYNPPKEIGIVVAHVFNKFVNPVMERYGKLGATDSEPRQVAAQYLVNVVKKALGISKGTYTSFGDHLEESNGKFKVSKSQLEEMIKVALKEKKAK
jgi:hypothetical protein